MTSTFFLGLTGAFMTFWVTNHTLSHLEWNLGTLFVAIVWSNIIGLFDLLAVLELGRRQQIKKYIMPSISWTWVWFFLFYVIPLWAGLNLLSPQTISARDMAYLFFPLAFSNGFCLILFGPIQDHLVRARQRSAS